MGLIGRYVAFGLMALVAAASLSLPVSVQAAQKSVKKKAVASKTLPTRQSKRVVRRAAPPAPPSLGHAAGLQATEDELDLKSSVALVLDQDTGEVLLSKNPGAVLPIASITKLMTAVVVSDAALAPDEMLSVSQDDVDTEKGSRSRLRVGTQLSRIEMMHLALMASENRAAHALGRHYPGGLPAFIVAMNRKAQVLGMKDTHYVEPTGLSSSNRSSARDLATLVKAAYQYPLIRELSTSPEYSVAVGKRQLQFRNTNGLVRSPSWDIGLQKTGYISEAGRCLVMQAKLAGRQLIMVFLDSAGKYSRLGDAERVRRWVSELAPSVPVTRIVPIAAPAAPVAVPPAPVIAPVAPVVPMAPAAAATATLSTSELVAAPES